jgi:ABC-2 type transport system permease protein
MKAYWSIFRIRFIVQMQYRAAALASFITNFFFGLVRVMVFQAFYTSTAAGQPLSLVQVVTYTWLTQVTFRMLPWVNDTEMYDLVRSGNVAYELCRPVQLYWAWYCRLLAYRLVPSLLCGVPIYLVIIVLPGELRASLPASPLNALAYILSLALALILSCALGNLITISTLWTTAGDGLQRIFPAIIMVFSGAIVPLSFFPGPARTILQWLPFAGLNDLPSRIYLGIVPPIQIFPVLGLQALWTMLFIGAGLWLLSRGLQRVEIQGG